MEALHILGSQCWGNGGNKKVGFGIIRRPQHLLWLYRASLGWISPSCFIMFLLGFLIADFQSCSAVFLCASWQSELVFLILHFPGNVTLPCSCLKMLRGLNVPYVLRLKIKITWSLKPVLTGLALMASLMILSAFPLNQSSKVRYQVGHSGVWLWLVAWAGLSLLLEN